MSKKIIKGRVFVLGDNIDTDQIIPAKYLNLVPTIPEEYKKLGSYALSGLPAEHKTSYIRSGEMGTEYPIIIAGRNFGCGSSREHAPISLGAAGCKAVIASSFARIFFRNCISTGELYPIETATDIAGNFKTGDEAEITIEGADVHITSNGKKYTLKSLGDVLEVIDSGGIFNYARKTGMI